MQPLCNFALKTLMLFHLRHIYIYIYIYIYTHTHTYTHTQTCMRSIHVHRLTLCIFYRTHPNEGGRLRVCAGYFLAEIQSTRLSMGRSSRESTCAASSDRCVHLLPPCLAVSVYVCVSVSVPACARGFARVFTLFPTVTPHFFVLCMFQSATSDLFSNLEQTRECVSTEICSSACMTSWSNA
jgi:hypothetical protein